MSHISKRAEIKWKCNMNFLFNRNLGFRDIGAKAPQKKPMLAYGRVFGPRRKWTKHISQHAARWVDCACAIWLKHVPTTTAKNKSLKRWPRRLHSNKTYINTFLSTRRTWACVFSSIAVTVSERALQIENSPHCPTHTGPKSTKITKTRVPRRSHSHKTGLLNEGFCPV